MDIQAPTQEQLEKELGHALQILKDWQCTESEIEQLLGSGYNNRRNCERADSDLAERQHNLIKIDEAIRGLFSNPENYLNFVRMENGNPPFEGKTPLEFMMLHVDGIKTVKEHLMGILAN